MRSMQLPRSRTALRQATQAVEELRAAKNDSELFRDRFVSTMGMVQRVGSIIDVETKGHRTPEFGKWWKKTQGDPLFVFMQDVRNAEFKRGERRQIAAHHVSAEVPIHISVSASWEHRYGEGGAVARGHSSDPPSPKPQTTVAESTDWYFSGGGQYDGNEVLSVVDRYIAWLRDDILPTAERLTK